MLSVGLIVDPPAGLDGRLPQPWCGGPQPSASDEHGLRHARLVRAVERSPRTGATYDAAGSARRPRSRSAQMARRHWQSRALSRCFPLPLPAVPRWAAPRPVLADAARRRDQHPAPAGTTGRPAPPADDPVADPDCRRPTAISRPASRSSNTATSRRPSRNSTSAVDVLLESPYGARHRAADPRALRSARRPHQRLRSEGARRGRRLHREEVRAGVDRRAAGAVDAPSRRPPAPRS